VDNQQPAPAVQSVTPAPATSLADIKALSQSAINDTIIIGQIRKTQSVYHLTTAEIIDLKKSGVSQNVIEFMVNTAGR
jgi:hypothetical protein